MEVKLYKHRGRNINSDPNAYYEYKTTREIVGEDPEYYSDFYESIKALRTIYKYFGKYGDNEKISRVNEIDYNLNDYHLFFQGDIETKISLKKTLEVDQDNSCYIPPEEFYKMTLFYSSGNKLLHILKNYFTDRWKYFKPDKKNIKRLSDYFNSVKIDIADILYLEGRGLSHYYVCLPRGWKEITEGEMVAEII